MKAKKIFHRIFENILFSLPLHFFITLSLFLQGCITKPRTPLLPIVTPALPSLVRVHEIILDAGHGGKDPGAIGPMGLLEKDVVLDIAQRLAEIFKDRGVKVILTRESDVFISLQSRTEMASQSQADLFVSIHANSSPIRSVAGVEVFSLKDLGYVEKNEVQRKTNYELMFETLAMKQGSKDLENILEDLLYSHKQAQSLSLAKTLSETVSQEANTENRGFKTSHFYVLRNTLIPAVLVEIGFLTHPREEKLLQTSAYRQKIAEGLARGILLYDSQN